MSKSDRPEVKPLADGENWAGIRPIQVKDWPGVPKSEQTHIVVQGEGEPIEKVDWIPLPPTEQPVLPPESHTLLDKWWQRVENELDEWEALGRELRGYVEKPEKSDRDNFDRHFFWRPVFGEFRELPDREEVHPTESNNEYSQFSEAVLGMMDLVSDVATYEVVIYDYKNKIWVDSKDMATPYNPIKFWSYIPEVVTIEFRDRSGE